MQVEGRPTADQRTRSGRRWLGIVLSVAALLCAAGGLFLWPVRQDDFAEKVGREVAAAVPVGTTVVEAGQWVRSYPAADDVAMYRPAGLPLLRLGGRSAAECAGLPPDTLREVACFRVRSRGPFGLVTGQAWVYLLIGTDGRVRGHHVTADDPPPPPSQTGPLRPWWRFW